MTDIFRLYTEGDALYAAMLHSIQTAKNCIYLESYIFADDAIGWRFAENLVAAVKSNVKVQVHLDAVGSLLWGASQIYNYLSANGVQVKGFHRWSWRRPWKYNQRNHRKLLIVDEQRLFLGGFNLHQESSAEFSGKECWRDTHIKISDPTIVKQATELFKTFWCGRRYKVSLKLFAPNLLIPNHPFKNRRALHHFYRYHFRKATTFIYLTTPYFVPDFRTQQALKQTAKRGVDVRLLLPGKSDIALTQWAAHAAYSNLLEAGVKIYEYLPRVLHAKTLVIDGKWATIGTANIDHRSFFANHEITLATRDTELCQQLEQQFLADLQLSKQILPKLWRKRPLYHAIFELIGWLARRIL